jgi:hypothetical protein
LMMSPSLMARILCSSTCIRSRSSPYTAQAFCVRSTCLPPLARSAHNLKSFSQ